MTHTIRAQRRLVLIAALIISLVSVPHASAQEQPGAWLDRLTIRHLRAGNYAGSPIEVEETLPAGRGYTRQIVSFRSEGLKQYALLLIPTGKSPANGWPAIVLNHGYVEPALYESTLAYEATMDAFARAGYIVFRPDFRGHGRSEGDAETPFLSQGYVVDALNAVASIKRHPDADPARIGMWGHSMGGWVTLRAMVAAQDIQAGIIWGGAVGTYEDMLANWLPALGKDGLMKPGAEAGSGAGIALALGAVDPLWRSLSANYYLGDLSGPLLLQHGEADRNVPVAFSRSVLEAGQRAGMPVELLTYRGDDHGLSRNFERATAADLAFFDRWLRHPINLSQVETPTVFAPGPVNLRAAPTTESAIVGRMRQGDRLPVVGANADRSWWQVETGQGRAWVSARVTLAAHTADIQPE
jgi:dipeptidyl aminopeptidase/acylaminoacyl peptidase